MITSTRRSRLGALAGVVHRRRRLVLAGWVVALVAAFALMSQAGGWSSNYATPGSDSEAASLLLDERFPERSAEGVDVVWRTADGADSAAARERVDSFVAAAGRLPGIGDGVRAADARVSADGETGTIRIPLSVPRPEVAIETGERLLELAAERRGDGLQLAIGGSVVREAERGAVSSELVGLAIAALILLITFGTVITAGLPLVTALFGLGISSTTIGLLAAVVDVPDWAGSVATMIGLGVGIDYALLIITRHRAELAAGADVPQALSRAIATAGRSVLIAGVTVVISLTGLFLMGLTYLNGVALSAIFAVLVVMAASVTLLPALLAIAGTRVDRLRIPGMRRAPRTDGHTPAARWSNAVQRRAWAAAVAAAAVLLMVAVPATDLRIGFPDAGNNPEGAVTRQAYELMSSGFGPGANGQLVVVSELHGGEDAARFERLAGRLRAEPGVVEVSAPAFNRAGDTGAVTVVPEQSPQSEPTEQLVHDLRDGPLVDAGLTVRLGGSTAAAIDQSAITASRLPLFIAGVVGLSLLLLLVAFRSLPLALKAAALNLLSVAAAYGVVAEIAKGGWLGQLVGIDGPTPVPPFIPILMFAVLFGLSMDYEVFLLSRVREEFLVRGDTGRAVTSALSRTARVITAAGAIMVAVFGAFALSDEIFLKLIGIGMASAIVMDVTIVRMVLVPALMQILGERTWWLPTCLDRLLPRTEVDAGAPARAG